jgi:hypothetical protein
MLKKCLKYDFEAVMRTWWIVAISMLGAAVIAGLGFRFFSQCMVAEEVHEGLTVLAAFVAMGSYFCIMAMIIGMTVSFILIFWRMYTHFYTDQGYLTFTLPVKRSTLYLSKVIMATVLEAATVGVLILGILFIALVVPPTEGGEFFISLDWIGAIGDFCRGLADVAGWWLILWIPAAVAILLMFALFQNGLIYFCITMGAVVAKRHKLIAAIGIYYGVNLAVGLVGEIVLIFLSAGIIAIIMAALMAGGAVLGLTVTAILFILALAMAVLSAILHFMTVNKLERKLNLA